MEAIAAKELAIDARRCTTLDKNVLKGAQQNEKKKKNHSVKQRSC